MGSRENQGWNWALMHNSSKLLPYKEDKGNEAVPAGGELKGEEG